MKQKFSGLMRSRAAQVISQLALGGIFVYASFGKIMNPQSFMTNIRNYRLVPEMFIKPIAMVLPWVELIFGVLLILNIFTKVSAIVLISLLVIFIIAIISTLIREINIDCGCFIQQKKAEIEGVYTSGYHLLIRDIIFLIPGIIILFFGDKPRVEKEK
jgi:uncharacterized membrane protein YphA (DoxX/SURF4 family)